MANVIWELRCYDIHGHKLEADSYDASLESSEVIRHAFNRQLTFNLNSFDQLNFSLYLDDPMALNIRRGTTVVKLFRTVDDTENDKSLDPEQPCFAGVVGYTNKQGQANTMDITVYSPLWRLQTHFHILNHYLETNPDTGDDYTQSELMWKLVDLVNEAFGGDSFTGMKQGLFLWGLPGEPQPTPYFVGKGTNTWSNIFDDLMNRPSSPDMTPFYYHDDGDRTMMLFSTAEKRGSDKSGSFSFNYRTNPAVRVPNLDDLQEIEQIVPGDFGNYIWVTGYGGANTGRFAARENASDVDGSDGTGEIGVYMAIADHSEVKRVDALSPLADAEFAKRKHPTPSYVATISSVAGIYYDVDFTLGDVVLLNSVRGALSFTNVKQRIYQATLSMSENNVETADCLISKDFYGKIDEDDD